MTEERTPLQKANIKNSELADRLNALANLEWLLAGAISDIYERSIETEKDKLRAHDKAKNVRIMLLKGYGGGEI